jgi:SSS family solute:Na+ symporter
VVPVLHQTAYIAVTAFVLNLVVAAVLTVLLRALKAPAGTDETRPADYGVDPAPGPVAVPVDAAP